MGLFSTVLHIYNRSQTETVNELTNELRENRELSRFRKLDIDNNNIEKVIQEYVYNNNGVYFNNASNWYLDYNC